MFAKTFAAASFSALLAGCGQTVVVKTVCPPIVEYQQAFLDRLDAQLATVGPAVATAIIDYRQLRDTIRACKG